MSSVPVNRLPRDEIREGLGSLRTDNTLIHPVQAIQHNYNKQQYINRNIQYNQLYGSALPQRLIMEELIVSKTQRLPGLKSSNIALDTLLWREDDITVSDYLNTIDNNERPVVGFNNNTTVNDLMEKRLGDKPINRTT